MESRVTILIWLALLFTVLYTINEVSNRNARYLQEQQQWDKLVSVADWVVKRGGAYESSEAVHPHWIDDERLAAIDREALRERMGMDTLTIGYAPGPGVCLYRLVVHGPQKEIVQLWVCG